MAVTVTYGNDGTKIALGQTIPGATSWVDASGAGIKVSIDTSAAGFTRTPMYFTSIGGDSYHWGTTGVTSIYKATPTSFEVAIRWDKGFWDANPLDIQEANQYKWHINWVGVEPDADQAVTPVSNKVSIFVDNNFGGASQQIGVGSYGVTGGEALTIGGDTLSSLKVPAGYKVTLYEHPNFGGRSKTFTSDATSVGDFNDITSSIRVERLLDPQKWYYIIAKHTGKVLNIAGSSKDNGANAIQYTKSVSDNSLWRFEDAGDGSYYIIAKHSGKALQVNGGNKNDGANVDQWTKENVNHHKWQLEHAGAEGYFYLVAKHSGKVLQVNDGSKDEAGNVNQWTKQDADHHKWTFEAAV